MLHAFEIKHVSFIRKY